MLRSPRARLPYRLSVHAVVADGRLHIHWGYSHLAHREQTIQRLADTYCEVARELVARLKEVQASHLDAGDVVAYGWSEADLRGIDAAIRGAHPGP